ncbi:MAG: hypothetical protein QOJ35_2153 [Solirubrobacteraceae bacterium]|nr:hypothetical protein [Solirubrobacteraceae bacterium]
MTLSRGGTPARILVVDDNPVQLRLVRRQLEERYRCDVATTVDEVREKLASEAFELVLCDVSLRDESGLVLAEEIVREFQRISVVWMTATDDPVVASDAFDRGAHGYLVKPFGRGQLLITAMSALRRRELELARQARARTLREQLQTVIDRAPMPIYAKDRSFRYILANRSTEEQARVGRGELIGLTDEAFMSPASAARVRRSDRLVLEGGEANEDEEMLAIGGEERTFLTVKFPLLDEAGEVQAVCGVSPDITRRRADQLAVAEELARMGSWVLDLRSRTTLWSAGMYRILGLPPQKRAYSAEEVLELVHPEDRERMGRLLSDVTARPEAVPGTGIEHVVRMVRADGSIRELRAVGKVDHDEAGPARWLGSVQDVTEQRLSERELRAHYSVSQALREWESFELGVVDLLRRVATALEYPMSSLWLWDQRTDMLACRAFWSAPDVDPGDFEAVMRGVSFADGQGQVGLAWQIREPVVTPDVATDPLFRPRDAAVASGIASAIAFPAVGPAGSVAVLSFYAFERGVPSAELLRTLTAIGRELGRFLSRRRAELGPLALTDREIEVLRLAAEGHTGRGIAEQLFISPNTVRTHFAHIFEKLGVGDRAAAVAHALRTGLIQ